MGKRLGPYLTDLFFRESPGTEAQGAPDVYLLVDNDVFRVEKIPVFGQHPVHVLIEVNTGKQQYEACHRTQHGP